MTAIAVLSRLFELGVAVSANEGRLKLDAPTGKLTPDLLELVREYKSEILAAVGRPQAPTPDRSAFDEWCRTEVKRPDEFDDADRAVLDWIEAGRPTHRPPKPASKHGGPEG